MDVTFALIFGAPGMWEMLIFGMIAVLLFGKRLPEVGRSLGKGLMEFKKGLQGIEDEIQSAASPSTVITDDERDNRQEATAPKFEPPAAEWKQSQQAGVAGD
jgi:sec-independent protein translocase protein TatA